MEIILTIEIIITPFQLYLIVLYCISLKYVYVHSINYTLPLINDIKIKTIYHLTVIFKIN